MIGVDIVTNATATEANICIRGINVIIDIAGRIYDNDGGLTCAPYAIISPPARHRIRL